MDIELQQVWFRADTNTALPERLSSRITVPLIATLCAALWAAILLGWHLVF